MCLRADILAILGHLNASRVVLLTLARRHSATLMPAYTHTQPAQPITFGHYLLAVIELMGRDERRLQAAFSTVNRSPLGACAISTTGFPIDRDFTAHLLGFEGLQLNSYGAIAATDYLTETASAIATAMLNLGRVTQDFLTWCTAEFGYLRLSNAWVQISSIMPQKRNPVPFEHVRVLASKALAQSQGIFTCLHNTPFGDINDAEDDLQPLVFNATGDAARALSLFAAVMEGCEVQTERMAERAASDFLTVTELADTLVRKEGELPRGPSGGVGGGKTAQRQIQPRRDG
jgi:argininosuccinate lyase